MSDQKLSTPPAAPAVSERGDGKDTKVFLLWCYGRKPKSGEVVSQHYGLWLSEEKALENVGKMLAFMKQEGWSVDCSNIHVKQMELHGFFVLPSGV